jgi:hypothetical protein
MAIPPRLRRVRLQSSLHARQADRESRRRWVRPCSRHLISFTFS